MAEDKIPENYQSENDDGTQVREEDEQDPTSVGTNVSPPKMPPSHPLMQPASTDHSPAGALQGGPFIGELPVRGPQYAQAMMHSDLGPEHHFVEPGSMPIHDMVPSPHDSSRRPSIFSTTNEYTSPPGTGMYSQQWQPGTTAPTTTSMYAFTTQQTTQTPGSYVTQPGVQLPQGQQYLGHGFDGMPRGAFDPNQGHMFRPGPVGPATVHTPYTNYLSSDGRNMSGPTIKVDTMPRNHLH
jgi:hypothetical protein